jgi:hypothetical protein
MAATIRLSVDKKYSNGNFGSTGATAAIEYEVDPTVVHSREALLAHTSVMYSALEQCLSAELARLGALTPAGVIQEPDKPEFLPAPALPTNPSNRNGTPPAVRPATTATRAKPVRTEHLPTSGSALWKWLKEIEEQGDSDGAVAYITKTWARGKNLSPRMKDWPSEAVFDAVSATQEWLDRDQR